MSRHSNTLTFEETRERLRAFGQEHVLRFWEDLNEAERTDLLRQVELIDLEQLQENIETLVKGEDSAEPMDFEKLRPAPYISHPERGGDASLWEEARGRGETLLADGKVAAFTVAGGQGTRLGFDGPKGTFPVTPVRQRSLFAVFADKIHFASGRYSVSIPWLIMTSPANHADTKAYFEEHDWFGLNPADVFLFPQGQLPAVDFEGRLLLEAPGRIVQTPDGHGGSLLALHHSGMTDELKRRGIDVISYFQVDNPLVRILDPAFIGFHAEAGSEMSSRMIPKVGPAEKIGMFCTDDSGMKVVEYSDMPMAYQEQRTPEDTLRFEAGSIAIHLLDRGFVERIGTGGAGTLPVHRAVKKIPFLDDSGKMVNPEEPNGVKFETFVFDALPLARHPIVVETLRENEFSPVKNATGGDSPETCRRDQLRQFARWLKLVGVEIPVDDGHTPLFPLEIGPRFAVDEVSFVEAWRALPNPPAAVAGVLIEPPFSS